MTKKAYLLFILVCFSLVLNANRVSGETTGADFSISTNIPDNQIDKQQSYFDLLMTPGQEQTISVVVYNHSSEKITVDVGIMPAFTNEGGHVQYTPAKESLDKTLTYDIRELVDGPTKVVLEPVSKQTVSFQVKMPDEPYDGYIAGGITFTERSKKSDGNNQSSGLINKIAYTTSLLMRQSLDNGQPDLKLRKVVGKLVNHTGEITANLQNPEATYLDDLLLKVELFRVGEQSVLLEYEQSDLQMAPNSNFDFRIPVEQVEQLVTGDYTIRINAYGNLNTDGPHSVDNSSTGSNQKYQFHWELTTDFHLIVEQKPDTADKFVRSKSSKLNWQLIVVSLIFVGIVVITWRITKKRQR
ncbi:DUF916 and DUF3324 domain-containing protein [Vagococcus acidifermentans]|uniref:Uncharacterized protein n=1 Tax=Vagococcus acidifermentans TaxID=564710 RepID=A0A430B2P5_9ENTE|nr:DUF916 and DUF3324 domain-containing protein [Vagococcus acidifermentans]RSU14605.1 hypothetical protein CBF27_01070 [Vagococcus acidifermentans]